MVRRKFPQTADTKTNILHAAERLFRRRGYDATSVQAIIDAARVSKGTFYYYFKSKEELLDALIEHLTHEVLKDIRAAVESEPASAVARLNRFLMALKAWRLRDMALFKNALQVLLRDENAIIREKSLKRNIALVSPLLGEIIRQGIDAGVFHVSDAEDTAELIIHIWTHLGEDTACALRDSKDVNSAVRTILRRVNFSIEAVERLLGAQHGAIERFDEGFLSQIMSAFYSHPAS